MARIAGVDIPKNKRGVIALTYIFGLGKSRAIEILEKAQVSQDKKVQDCKVRILGDEYCLVTNEPHEHIIESAGLVDLMMREIIQNSTGARVDEKKMAVLTALRIASRALKSEADMRELLEEHENLVTEIDRELQLHFMDGIQ